MATRCPAGSLAKTLFPQEIVVTSVGDLKLSSQQFKCCSWKIFCLEQVNTELIRNTFTSGYNLFVASSTSSAGSYLALDET